MIYSIIKGQGELLQSSILSHLLVSYGVDGVDAAFLSYKYSKDLSNNTKLYIPEIKNFIYVKQGDKDV